MPTGRSDGTVDGDGRAQPAAVGGGREVGRRQALRSGAHVCHATQHSRLTLHANNGRTNETRNKGEDDSDSDGRGESIAELSQWARRSVPSGPTHCEWQPYAHTAAQPLSSASGRSTVSAATAAAHVAVQLRDETTRSTERSRRRRAVRATSKNSDKLKYNLPEE